MKKYNPSEIEPKWQTKWREEKLYQIDLDKAKKPYYLLVEFPYSSGDLHIGHWFAFAVTDIFGRFKRMNGFDVFFPIGFDAFGLPAENAAIKRGLHPKDWTLENIKNMKDQYQLMGAIHDWEHMVVTCFPEYYKWNQWIFLKMLERGIAYKGKTLSNWCPVDQTVLADEQIAAGKCDRCGADVVLKEVDQWFLKITEYADRLLWNGNEKVDWPKSVMEGQNSWIGKSEGMEIKFVVASEDRDSADSQSEAILRIKESDRAKQTHEESITAYTVFPETIFGVTYMVLAPEHRLVFKITTKEQKEEVEKYIKIAQKKSQQERISLDKQKTGVFTGSYCVNPVNGKKVPIWIADYVIAGYGTGAVMGVPGSDHRDFEFAKKYDLEIKRVIAINRVIGKTVSDADPVEDEAQVLEEGVLVNSEQFNGLTTPEPAREKIKDWMEEKRFGRRKTQFHLHDWSISRQRYWGTPIPIINCKNCGIVPVPYEDLPVELPYEVDHSPRGKPPLATAEDWMKVKCPKCGGDAAREPETMDGFVDNSWYFFRYLSPDNESRIFDQSLVKKWMPLDIYFGGAEHTLGHTLYSRFFTRFFFDLKLIEFDEYALKRVNHGVILGPDSRRMSKSRGNVVNPDQQIKKFGADAVRVYLAFIGPYAIVAPWNPGAIKGVYNFLQRVWNLSEKVEEGMPSAEGLKFMHKSIKKLGEDISGIKFNTAVAQLMEWLNYLRKKDGKVSREEYKTFLTLLAPFAPHITEELWSHFAPEGASRDGNWSIHQQSWPEFDSRNFLEVQVKIVAQVNGKVRDIILIDKDIGDKNEVVEKMALESESVKKFLRGKNPKNTIYVRGRLINFVV